MAERVFNFSAGPAVLPLPVLEEAQRDLLALPGAGASILEISHRSKQFDLVIEQAEANLRKLLGIPEGYQVLFLQGGALLQFGMVPMNILRGTGKSADYIVTGSWSKKALSEAKTQGPVRIAWDGEATKYRRLPQASELDLRADAAYAYFTSNETIQGVQFRDEPAIGNVPLVCDASSDILSRPVEMSRYGLLFASAQKNAGPAGVTLVVVRDDLLARSAKDLPSMLNYRVLAESKSLLNTPPVFSIYILKLVTDWLLGLGGLEKVREINVEKAQVLYDVIDQSGGYYSCHAEHDSRSVMNVTFRLPNADLEKRFLEEAECRGLSQLKGHRSVGGCRASIYNAMPREGCVALADFMKEFAAAHPA